MKNYIILLTNDDGYKAKGLLTLYSVLKTVYKVYVCAPLTEQSGCSHSLTLRKPIKVKRIKPNFYAIDGTPTDCVLLSHHHLLKESPDLLISGINHGPNMGDDVFYSGTVAAAIQGALLGIPSLAVSLAGENLRNFKYAATWTKKFLRTHLPNLARSEILNINIPEGVASKAVITRLGKRIYQDEVVKKNGPDGMVYCVIDGTLSFRVDEGTDFKAIADGIVSITPLNLDLTDHRKILSYPNSIS